jgi:hypothetical protein
MASGKFFTKNVKVTDVLAECYGKKGCHHKVMAIGMFSMLPAQESSGTKSTLPIKIQVKFMTDPGPRTILSPLIKGTVIVRLLNVNEKAWHYNNMAIGAF